MKRKLEITIYECPKCHYKKEYYPSERNAPKVCKSCGEEMVYKKSRYYIPPTPSKGKALETRTASQALTEINKPKTTKTIIECPYCHSSNVKKISNISRMASIGFFGFASKKIGKQWHCNECGSDF